VRVNNARDESADDKHREKDSCAHESFGRKREEDRRGSLDRSRSAELEAGVEGDVHRETRRERRREVTNRETDNGNHGRMVGRLVGTFGRGDANCKAVDA
jgi:hypothetical protein